MKSLLVKVIIVIGILISSVYFFGQKQISAKQNLVKQSGKNTPSVDFHYTWLDLYVGFDIENASKYPNIGYKISYTNGEGQLMVVQGIITNYEGESSIEREKIILGSCSTGGTCSYDNRTSPVTLTLEFSRSTDSKHPNYTITKILE